MFVSRGTYVKRRCHRRTPALVLHERSGFLRARGNIAAMSSSSSYAKGKASGGAQLKVYWTTGEGGVKKIRWNTPGDFTRCVRYMRKYAAREGFSAEGYCARLHKAATGVYPGDKRNVGKRG
ncbi:hypothetical protein SEA_WHOSEMANZ_22 [Gordonia phage WhoseManz]|nr:hypothetical protein SEA_WHOSEMANZ_22 [Gordonia phage WhoseManz]